jgi:hypothetical protein
MIGWIARAKGRDTPVVGAIEPLRAFGSGVEHDSYGPLA